MTSEKYRMGVVASTFATDVREAARLARVSGFSGLQFDAFSASLDLTGLSHTGRREFCHVLGSNDQQLIGLRVDLGPRGFCFGADIDRLLSRFDKVMDAAKGLGAPLLCVEVGPLPEPAAPPKPKPHVDPAQAGVIIIPTMTAEPQEPQASRPVPGPDPALIAQVDGALFELCIRADRTGVTVALRSDLSSFAALDRAITAARCPWFSLDLDPVAILRDAWTADEIFSRFGNVVRHVRARDATAGSDRRTRPAVIGQGSTNWNDLLANLDAAGYSGWLTIDPLELSDRITGATAGASHLQKTAP